jgi:hypothetical protein
MAGEEAAFGVLHGNVTPRHGKVAGCGIEHFYMQDNCDEGKTNH